MDYGGQARLYQKEDDVRRYCLFRPNHELTSQKGYFISYRPKTKIKNRWAKGHFYVFF